MARLFETVKTDWSGVRATAKSVESWGGSCYEKLLSRGQMGDCSCAKSLALTWVGLEKPGIRQEKGQQFRALDHGDLYIHKSARNS